MLRNSGELDELPWISTFLTLDEQLQKCFLFRKFLGTSKRSLFGVLSRLRLKILYSRGKYFVFPVSSALQIREDCLEDWISF
jgi:hypothetical protein